MQVITIDLKKNPDIADLLVDMEPGDILDLHCSIKAMDDQTCSLTVQSAEEGREPAENETEKGSDLDKDNNDGRNPQGDAVTSPGSGLNGGSDVGGGEMASV